MSETSALLEALLALPTGRTRPGASGPAPQVARGTTGRVAPRAEVRQCLTLVRRLCGPLAYLHGEGLVHRDLKPENILLRGCRKSAVASRGPRARAAGTHGARAALRLPLQLPLLPTACSRLPYPVLVDFGLAAAVPASEGREALQVERGGAGTVLYMAPEQIRAEPLDARADLYSLGCVLYELLAGRPPFAGASAQEILRGHLYGEPRRPSELAGPLPEGLDELVLRLLAKSPRERLGHAEDLGRALEALGADRESWPEAPQPRAYLYRPELAGREAPLAELERALDRLESGAGGVLFVAGESGVGKTRLLLDLSRRAVRRQVRVLAGECVPAVASSGLRSARADRGRSDRSHEQKTFAGGGGPLEALRKPLQALADQCRERGAEETERLLGRRGKVLAAYVSELASLPGQEAYPEPAELPAEAARLRLHSYLAETFAAAADEAPLLLLLDDLQWADELTLGWLEHWQRVRAAGGRGCARLQVVGTYRSEEAGAAAGSKLRRLVDAEGVEVLELHRLPEASVGAIVRDMLALPAAPELFARHLARHSEGNPFFVAEYLRAAVAEGLLYRDAQGRWQVAEAGEQHRLFRGELIEDIPEGLRRWLRETGQLA